MTQLLASPQRAGLRKIHQNMVHLKLAPAKHHPPSAFVSLNNPLMASKSSRQMDSVSLEYRGSHERGGFVVSARKRCHNRIRRSLPDYSMDEVVNPAVTVKGIGQYAPNMLPTILKKHIILLMDS